MSARFSPILAGIAVVFLLAGCGGAAEPPPTAAPPTEPPPLASDTVPADTPTPAGEMVVLDDPPGDCILNTSQVPTPCVPTSFDLLRVSIERASPLTITVFFERDGLVSGDGVPGLGDYVLLHGVDLDRDPATGATSGWPEQHGVAPDLIVFYQVQAGQARAGVTLYAPDGTASTGDASLTEWRVVDDFTIEVVVSDALVSVSDFGLAGDLLGAQLYDHYVDGGHLEFPSGEVVMVP